MKVSSIGDNLEFKMKGKSMIETPTSEDMSNSKMSENVLRNKINTTINKNKLEN